MLISPANRILLAWASIAIPAAVLAWMLAPVLLPFLAALTLAYGLHPAVDRLARLRVPRALGAALAIALLSAAVAAFAGLVIAVLKQTLPEMRAQLPALIGSLLSWATAETSRIGLPVQGGLGALATRALSADPATWTGRVLESARTGSGTLFSLGVNLILIPVLTFYLLLDWHALMQRAWNLVPLPRRDGLRVFLRECDAMLGGYLRGQVAVMSILSVYYSAALAIAGFQLALPIGAFTGLAVCVPFVGYGVGLLLALLAGVLQFPGLHAIGTVAVVYGIGQVLESYVLTPRLVGRRIGLHPLLVIFLLLAAGELFGFVGVLLALPAGALLTVVARHVMADYRASPLFLGH